MSEAPAPDELHLRATIRTWTCFALAGPLFGLAVAAHSPLPLFAAVPLLLAPLAAMVADPGPVAASTLHWEESGTESAVTIAGTVDLPPRVDAEDVSFELLRPPAFAEVEAPRVDRAARRLTFRTRWLAREPVLDQVVPPRLVWRDALGLLERPLRVDGPALSIERYPPEITRLGDVHLRHTIVLPGENRSRAIGESGDFFGIRPSVASDSPRRINWRAWARTGKRYTNEFSLERTGDVLLYVDARPTVLGPEIDGRLLGLSRAAAAGLASAFLREKARVGLAVFGEFVEVLPLGSGKAQRHRIREQLLNSVVAPTSGPSERGAVPLRHYFPPGLTTIVFTPLADDAGLSLLIHLRRRGFPPAVLSPSPIGVQLSNAPLHRADEELVGRLARLVRRQQVARAWRDAPVVDWSEYWSLAGFTRFLERGVTIRGPR